MNWPSFGWGALAIALLWVLQRIFIPDLLDWHKQERRARHERDARAETYMREDEPIRRRICAAMIAELEGLQRMINGSFPIDEWQRLHDELARQVATSDAARALSDLYQSMDAAVRHDQFSIGFRAREEARWQPIDPRDVGYSREIMYRQAMTKHNAAGVISGYCGPLSRLDPVAAKRFSDFADSALKLVEVMFQRAV